MKRHIKSIFKSRTMLASMALAVLAVIQGYVTRFDLSPDAQMYIGLVLAVIIAVLRVYTTAALFQPTTEYPVLDNGPTKLAKRQKIGD